VQDSIDFTVKVNEYIEQYNNTVSIEESEIILDKIQALSNQYGFTVSFLASARAELANFVPETAVKKFNDYVDEYNVRMSADKRSVLANRSEEHTSELQSRFDLVCRLLLEKKKKI